jgi:hypothetical protein
LLSQATVDTAARGDTIRADMVMTRTIAAISLVRIIAASGRG